MPMSVDPTDCTQPQRPRELLRDSRVLRNLQPVRSSPGRRNQSGGRFKKKHSNGKNEASYSWERRKIKIDITITTKKNKPNRRNKKIMKKDRVEDGTRSSYISQNENRKYAFILQRCANINNIHWTKNKKSCKFVLLAFFVFKRKRFKKRWRK